MKKSFCGFLAVFFLIFNIIPSFSIYADNGYSDSQLSDIGSLVLASMLANGEATELDFTNYTGDDTDLLIAIGEMAVSGDITGLVECGLDWLGDVIDETYDNIISYIRQWEYSVAPNLYDYWYNGNLVRIDSLPTKRHSQLFSKLLVDNSNINIPDDTFSWLSDINNFFVYDPDFNSIPFYDFSLYGWYSGSQSRFFTYTPLKSLYNVSYCADNTFTRFHHSDTATSYNELRCSVSSTIISIYATINLDGSVDVTYDNVNLISSGSFWQGTPSQEASYKGFRPTYQSSGYNQQVTTPYIGINAFSSNHNNGYYGYFDGHYDSFTLFANSIYSRFCNIKLYVNGNLWIDSLDTNYPITIPGALTVLNELPTRYFFPSDTFIDLSNLKQILLDAFHSYDIINWNDIKDIFVDVNGQEAIATLEVHDNNYDEMYLWQYPYILLPSSGDYSVFNPNLLNEVSNNLNVPIDIVDNTVDILPSDIVGVLAIGGILTIFACIINRLLE